MLKYPSCTEVATLRCTIAWNCCYATRVLVNLVNPLGFCWQVKGSVQVVKDKAKAIVDAIAVDKAFAVDKLEAARPALEEAEAALATIKASHISTVKKLGKPPHLIMRIMDCCLILFQKRIDSVLIVGPIISYFIIGLFLCIICK